MTWITWAILAWLVFGLVGFLIRLGNRETWPKWYMFPIIIPIHLVLGVLSVIYGVSCLNSKKYQGLSRV